MSGLSCLTESPSLAADGLRLNRARHDFLKHAMLEWCELEAMPHMPHCLPQSFMPWLTKHRGI